MPGGAVHQRSKSMRCPRIQFFFLVLWCTKFISFDVHDPIGGTTRRHNPRLVAVEAFVPVASKSIAGRQMYSTITRTGRKDHHRTQTRIEGTSMLSTTTSLPATRPQRITENADGPLYVNDKCINCAACSMFAPSIFARGRTTGRHHIVSKQPISEQEIEDSRAALAACPVAAIRVDRHESKDSVVSDQLAINPNFNGRSLPFPKPISPNRSNVYFVGHHNSKSFGAAPYLVSSATLSSSSEPTTWIMVDTPKYSKSAVRAVESATGPRGPSYLVLTHVDDTADHNKWKEHYPDLQRIFHAGDLGVHNWIGDKSLEDVEILLQSRSSDRQLQYFRLDGKPIQEEDAIKHDVFLVHTPGHSPGSIAMVHRPSDKTSPGVLFSGDTYSYTTRDGGHMSGFPLYGNDARLQSHILPLLLDLDWYILAPGHGHVRDYTLIENHRQGTETTQDLRAIEMEAAIDELSQFF